MAIIRRFESVESPKRIHPTVVDCGFSVFVSHGAPYLQLQTYGSDNRATEKKVSQTIQLDRHAMLALLQILADALGAEPGVIEGTATSRYRPTSGK